MLGNEIFIGDKVITYLSQRGKSRNAGLVVATITAFTPKAIRTDIGLKGCVVLITKQNDNEVDR